MVKRFVAQFNAHLSSGSRGPVRVVGSLKTDNAGEYLSREFTQFLDDEGIAHTTCPPHVHQLNGVAERARRSIMDQVRSQLRVSNLSRDMWAFAAQHSVDIINRTSGPPDTEESSYELLTE